MYEMNVNRFKRGHYAILKSRPVKIIDINLSQNVVEFRYLDDPNYYSFQAPTAELIEINQDTAKVLYGKRPKAS